MKRNPTVVRRMYLLTFSFAVLFYGSAGVGKAAPATMPTTEGMEPAANAANELIPQIEVEAGNLEDDELPVAGEPRPNDFWWPKILDVSPIDRSQVGNPFGEKFSYREAFSKLDLKSVRADLRALMTNSQAWWPADYGTYGPLFIRMSWHSAGTYRAADGRGGADGGQQQFEPLNSWPDNANLDKARRLIQPIVDKYYPNLSWADAIILAGDEALRSMGFETLGFAGGRQDDWSPDLVYWGPEDKFMASKRFDENGNLLLPLAASVMGLIYVNPEGPDGKPDPVASGKKIRETFGRMGMDDHETVALIAGGHTFGKAHGADKPEKCLEAAPAGASPERQQLGWHNTCGKGNAEDTITSGLEGSWSPEPTKWTNKYLTNLFKYTWKVDRGPGGKWQWHPENPDAEDAPNAHGEGRKPLMMLTPDVALREDPDYRVIALDYRDHPERLKKAFGRAWFKLTHRDLGPKSRYLGDEYPKEDFIWQDPIPVADYHRVDAKDIERLEAKIRDSEMSVSDLIKTAWAGAVTFRGTDMRGGLNGARLRLAPQRDWEVNEPELLKKNLAILEKVAADFNEDNRDKHKKISLADLIVLAGNVGVEEAAKKAGHKIKVSFVPGRTDASQEQTDVKSFGYLKVTNDGFRNYYAAGENYLAPAEAFVDRAALLNLTVPEMAVLTGGLRVLGANHGDSKHGVFTKTPGVLTNDFFVNLMDMSTIWSTVDNKTGVFVGKSRDTGEVRWTATTHDLIFGSQSQLRSAAFVYSSQNAKAMFVRDFVRTWEKVMNLDRFDRMS